MQFIKHPNNYAYWHSRNNPNTIGRRTTLSIKKITFGLHYGPLRINIFLQDKECDPLSRDQCLSSYKLIGQQWFLHDQILMI